MIPRVICVCDEQGSGPFPVMSRSGEVPMAASVPTLVSFGRRLAMLADAHPDTPAIIFVRRDGEEERLPWRPQTP
jgi:hypothetical protein